MEKSKMALDNLTRSMAHMISRSSHCSPEQDALLQTIKKIRNESAVPYKDLEALLLRFERSLKGQVIVSRKKYNNSLHKLQQLESRLDSLEKEFLRGKEEEQQNVSVAFSWKRYWCRWFGVKKTVCSSRKTCI